MIKKITREFYIPANSQKLDTISDIAVYQYMNSKNQLSAVCFVGRTTKPTWSIAFNNSDELLAHVQKTTSRVIAKRKLKADLATDRKVSKQEAIRMINVGDIFVERSSYEYTVINFWQVITKQGAKLELRQLSKTLQPELSSGCCEYYLPEVNNFSGEEIMAKSIRAHHERTVFLSGNPSYYSVHSWNCKAVYETAWICR